MNFSSQLRAMIIKESETLKLCCPIANVDSAAAELEQMQLHHLCQVMHVYLEIGLNNMKDTRTKNTSWSRLVFRGYL